MSDNGISVGLLNSLGTKLEGLDLTDEEAALLEVVFERAGTAGEVEAYYFMGEFTGVKNGQPMGLAKALGFALPDIQMIDPEHDTPPR